MSFSILEGNCLDLIPFLEEKVDLTYLEVLQRLHLHRKIE